MVSLALSSWSFQDLRPNKRRWQEHIQRFWFRPLLRLFKSRPYTPRVCASVCRGELTGARYVRHLPCKARLWHLPFRKHCICRNWSGAPAQEDDTCCRSWSQPCYLGTVLFFFRVGGLNGNLREQYAPTRSKLRKTFVRSTFGLTENEVEAQEHQVEVPPSCILESCAPACGAADTLDWWKAISTPEGTTYNWDCVPSAYRSYLRSTRRFSFLKLTLLPGVRVQERRSPP